MRSICSSSSLRDWVNTEESGAHGGCSGLDWCMGMNQEATASMSAWTAIGSAGSEGSGVRGDGERESVAVTDDEDMVWGDKGARREEGGQGTCE